MGSSRKSTVISANAIAAGAAAVGMILLMVIAEPAGWSSQSAPPAPSTSVPPGLAADAPQVPVAPSIVASGGVTLHSISVNFPGSDHTFPGGASADAINRDCLLCHSASMVLTQPSLSRSDWQAEVEKMRNVFKAPVPAEDVPAIVDYLGNLNNVSTQAIAPRQPDAKHGAVIVAQGTASGAPACAQCHAFNGVSDGSGAFPRLADQSVYYLTKQMRDFASGVRANAIMSPIAKALSGDDIADVSAYYSRIDAPFPQLKAPDPALVKQGEELAKLGDAARQIQSCDRCHGPGGAGEPPAVPYLAGQYAHYTSFTLHMWQQGYRNSSPDGMQVMAKKLNEQETAAVAAYYQQVRPQSTVEAAESQGQH
jgi:cytochrome c553